MPTVKRSGPADQEFWDKAALAALGGMLASGEASLRRDQQLSAQEVCRFADAVDERRDVRKHVKISPESLEVPFEGISSATFDVSGAGERINWSASTTENWIKIAAPTAAMTGDGKVTFSVEAQSLDQSPPRKGSIQVVALDLTFLVNQAAKVVEPNNPVPKPDHEPDQEQEPVGMRHPQHNLKKH